MIASTSSISLVTASIDLNRLLGSSATILVSNLLLIAANSDGCRGKRGVYYMVSQVPWAARFRSGLVRAA